MREMPLFRRKSPLPTRPKHRGSRSPRSGAKTSPRSMAKPSLHYKSPHHRNPVMKNEILKRIVAAFTALSLILPAPAMAVPNSQLPPGGTIQTGDFLAVDRLTGTPGTYG